jgi:hypothetical protein
MRDSLMYCFEHGSQIERMRRQLIDIVNIDSFRFAERSATD